MTSQRELPVTDDIPVTAISAIEMRHRFEYEPNLVVGIEFMVDSEPFSNPIEILSCLHCCRPAITISCDGTYEFAERSGCTFPENTYSCQQAYDFVIQFWKMIGLSVAERTYLNQHIPTMIIASNVGPRKLSFTFSKRDLRLSMDLGIMMGINKVIKFRHTPGCFFSDSPEAAITHHSDQHKMTKDIHFKLCNDALVNIEGIILGLSFGERIHRMTLSGHLTNTRNILAWYQNHGQDETCLHSFLHHASDEARNLFQEIASYKKELDDEWERRRKARRDTNSSGEFDEHEFIDDDDDDQ